MQVDVIYKKGGILSDLKPETQPQDWWKKHSVLTKFIMTSMAVFTVLGISVLLYRLFISTGPGQEYRWEILVLAQSWPFTSCKALVNNRAGCRLPSKSDFWTIHGVWPKKIGSFGPDYCKSSNILDTTEISSIQSDLSEYWVNIKSNQQGEAFWSYEWKKHGTCAADLPALNTQGKYFNKALELIKAYNMKDILDKASINPDSTKLLELETIWLAVKNQLGYNPSIHCAYDKTIKQHYLQEIRICFDRNFDLTDCEASGKNKQKILGNCPYRKPIIYPSSVPSL